jgi:CYTH domain-containing protein
MPVEIERKFLVLNDSWKPHVTAVRHLRDGLVARFGGGKVRVRLETPKAWITVKGAKDGIGRPEYEYEIPHADAEEILRTLCEGPPVEKTRHLVPHDGLIWEIDVFEGLLAGIVFAEVELRNAATILNLPDWIGAEITGDPRYRKTELFRQVAAG